MDQKFIELYSGLSTQIMSRLAENGDSGNIVFSPFSIIMLLAMAANAASGETRGEIVEALTGGTDYRELTDLTAELRGNLEGEKVFESANAAIVREDFKEAIAEGYAEQLEHIFDGALISCGDPVSAVNEWAKVHTDGMIREVLKSLPESAVACLINAVLFDAQWKNKYEDFEIRDRVFNNADGSRSKVPMMLSEEHILLENEHFIGFAKEYKENYSFAALLPKDETITAVPLAAIKSLDITELYRSRKLSKISVHIPEFEAKLERELTELCRQMGIRKAFLPQEADFSNMSKAELFISEIIHKAVIKVNRKGTKAAAVTMAVSYLGALCFDQIIDLNRPFVYAVIHNDTDIPVFMGTVNSLKKEK